MLILRLVRKYGNPNFTVGLLTSGDGEFACNTLERRVPEEWGGLKALVALPAGDYKMSLYTDSELRNRLKVSHNGAYRLASFTDEKLRMSPAGSIVVGRKVNGEAGVLKDCTKCVQALSNFIEKAKSTGVVPWSPKPKDFMLQIRYDEHFYFDSSTKPENNEAEEVDWNFVDDYDDE